MKYYKIRYRKTGDSKVYTSRYQYVHGEVSPIVKVAAKLFNIPQKLCSVVSKQAYNPTEDATGVWQALRWSKKANAYVMEGTFTIHECVEVS